MVCLICFCMHIGSPRLISGQVIKTWGSTMRMSRRWPLGLIMVITSLWWCLLGSPTHRECSWSLWNKFACRCWTDRWLYLLMISCITLRPMRSMRNIWESFLRPWGGRDFSWSSQNVIFCYARCSSEVTLLTRWYLIRFGQDHGRDPVGGLDFFI